MSKKAILSSTLILAISSLLSRVLGVVRDHLFASRFGALHGGGIFDLDAYYAAFRIPDLLFQILIIGAVSTAFVPIFSDYLHTDQKEKAWKFLDTTLTGIGLLMLIVSTITLILSPWIIPLLVPGFSPEKIHLTTQLTQIMLLSPICFGLSSIFQGVENSAKKYTYFALAPIAYNLSIILGTLFFSANYGVYAVAIGVSIGSLFHASIQLPAIFELGYRYRPNFNFRSPDVKYFIRLAIPRIFSTGVNQFNLVINTLIASTFITGSIAAFNFAFNMQSVALGLIGISISIVAFGIFAHQMATGDHDGMRTTLSEKIEQIILFTLPATLGLIALRTEIVTTLLGAGNFTGQDITLTANLLAIFAISLLAQNLIPLLGRYFFAQKNTRTPVKISITGLTVDTLLSLYLGITLHYQITGVVTAFTIACYVQLFLYLLRIRSDFTTTHLLHLKKQLQIIFASIIMLFSVLLTKATLETMLIPGRLRSIIILVGCSIIGYLIYLFTLKLLKYPRYHQLWRIRGDRAED
ncbi:MAG: murein biosynthesis integral membrane protein MurJ [Candidatus Peregrinibacteria bacterium]|nr:murein biosynthesis integral membrane protein MurJ [Candidatus Peregrinibacteria bacterium]